VPFSLCVFGFCHLEFSLVFVFCDLRFYLGSGILSFGAFSAKTLYLGVLLAAGERRFQN